MRIWRYRAVIAIIFILTFMGIYQVHAARQKLAMITGLYGSVEVYQDNIKKTPKLEMLLYKDDRVVTGGNGKAVLLLKDGSELKMAPKTDLLIEDKGRKRGILVKIGTVFANMVKGNFEIRSPYGAAAIEGTELQVDVSGNSSKVAVKSGKVAFINGKGSTPVAASYQAISTSMGIPIPRATEVNVERLVRWQIAIERYDYAIKTITDLFDKIVQIKQSSPGGWSLAGARAEMKQYNDTIDLLNSMAEDAKFSRGHRALKQAAYAGRQYLSLNDPAMSNKFLVQYQVQMKIAKDDYEVFKHYFEEEIRKFLL